MPGDLLSRRIYCTMRAYCAKNQSISDLKNENPNNMKNYSALTKKIISITNIPLYVLNCQLM